MADRLIILGMFYQKVEQYIQVGRLQEIPQLIASYTVPAEGNGLTDMLSDIPVLSTIQMELLKNLIDSRDQRGKQSLHGLF